MTNWRYKQILKLIKDFQSSEAELCKAIEKTLWQMRQICVKHGLMKKLSKKEQSKLYFEFRNGLFGIDNKTILLTNLHHNYGELIYSIVQEQCGLPVSWLWKKTWEAEFIKQWVKPWQEDKKRDEETAYQEELELYERLKEKHDPY